MKKGSKHTEGAKKKNSDAHIGKKYHLGFKVSDKGRKKMSESHKGQISWNKGLNGCYSKETLEKMSISHIGQCGYWLNKNRPDMLKENNPSWNGGTSFLPYCSKFNNKLKEQIRERDNRICQECNKIELENNEKLTVHHVHYDKPNCNPDLISLCRQCNIKANYNRDYWEEHFMKKLEERDLLNWRAK